MDSDYIVLDTLDGFEFEELCAEIYRRLGYRVENVRDTGDEGRDLVITSPDGETIVAECKHWPRGLVGRPVVQKLHSAVLTWPAQRGILLTTGLFAKPAREYANKLDVKIDLVDLANLKDLAVRAGFILVSASAPMPIGLFATSDSEVLKRRLDAQLFNLFTSSPSSPGSLVTVVERLMQLQPTFLIRYSARQDFATSVGLLHRLDVKEGFLLIDGANSKPIDERIANFLRGAAVLPIDQAARRTTGLRGFSLGVTEVKEKALEHIVRLHTTSVSYTGRNNQSYTLNCTPSKRCIFIRALSQVYLPEQHVTGEVLQNRYSLDFIENERGFHWLKPTEMFTCSICLRTFDRGLLCNSCGATAHKPRFFWPHSFLCRVCRKTICKKCAFYVRRWLLLRWIMCRECASKHGEGVHKLVA